MSRLIDQIQTELSHKNLLGEVSHICLSKGSLNQLMDEFKDLFGSAYMELGRDPNLEDVQEYLNTSIIVGSINGEQKKYQLLKKV